MRRTEVVFDHFEQKRTKEKKKKKKKQQQQDGWMGSRLDCEIATLLGTIRSYVRTAKNDASRQAARNS